MSCAFKRNRFIQKYIDGNLLRPPVGLSTAASCGVTWFFSAVGHDDTLFGCTARAIVLCAVWGLLNRWFNERAAAGFSFFVTWFHCINFLAHYLNCLRRILSWTLRPLNCGFHVFSSLKKFPLNCFDTFNFFAFFVNVIMLIWRKKCEWLSFNW